MNSNILTYKDDFLFLGNFIMPDGKNVSLNIDHEDFAKKYCMGDGYELLLKAKNKEIEGVDYQELLNIFANTYQRSIYYEEYITSHLDDLSLKLYLLWNKLYPTDSATFLVRVLGWDKVEPNLKTIITSSSIPHIRFYNYFLMDWELIKFPKLIADFENEKFIQENSNEFSLYNHKDISYEEDIELIKRNTSKKLRLRYFKE